LIFSIVPNVFPNMFLVAISFCPICFDLSSTCIR
jgi:hypothetical protein